MAKPADKATALWVLNRLRKAGFDALLAGGCVRDMLMRTRSTDYDLATSATPYEVKKLFGHVLLIGAQFGVAMVIHKGRTIEVASFRSDVSYTDGRRPDAIRSATPRQDAERRDFTINGMFYDPLAQEVIDYVGGRKDLEHRIVRTIGSPDRRFSEDYLRMIRAVRFSVRLGFRISPTTATAIKKHASKIEAISGERICDELSKMLSAASGAEAMEQLAKMKLAQVVLPELFTEDGLWPRAMQRVASVARPQAAELAFGGLLGELPAGTIRKIMRRWGAANELRDQLVFYSTHMGDWQLAADWELCRFKRLMASPYFPNLRALWRSEEFFALPMQADAVRTNRRQHDVEKTFGNRSSKTARRTQAKRITARAAGIAKSRIAPKPFVAGEDLKRMGLAEGPPLGKLLLRLYDMQLNEELTSRRAALAKARKLAGDIGA